MQVEVATTLVLEEVIDEVFNISVSDVLGPQLVKEVLEIKFSDIAFAVFINELKQLRFLDPLILNGSNDVVHYCFLNGSTL